MDRSNTLLDDPIVAWRAVILYGQNTATYKIALGHALKQFVDTQHDRVTLADLSEGFFDLYVARLSGGKPQLSTPGRLTRMEHIIEAFYVGRLTRSQAIEQVGQEAFRDVIHRFHTLPDGTVAPPFYERQPDGGLVLTDAAFQVFARDAAVLVDELDSRWDLLEAAFELKREPGDLATDLRRIYLQRGYERTSVTALAPVLHGYQEGRCFYCGEPILGGGHVDHVIPRQFVQHDEPWNLVLAHGFCNTSKSDQLPGRHVIEQLVSRNEAIIASNHPLREKIIATLGSTPRQRRQRIQQTYQDAQVVIPWEWTGVPGFEPATSDFYRQLVRGLRR